MHLIIKILSIVYLICLPATVRAQRDDIRGCSQRHGEDPARKGTLSFARTDTYRATNSEIFAALIIIILVYLVIKFVFFSTHEKTESQCHHGETDSQWTDAPPADGPTNYDVKNCNQKKYRKKSYSQKNYNYKELQTVLNDDFDRQEGAEVWDSYSWNQNK